MHIEHSGKNWLFLSIISGLFNYNEDYPSKVPDPFRYGWGSTTLFYRVVKCSGLLQKRRYSPEQVQDKCWVFLPCGTVTVYPSWRSWAVTACRVATNWIVLTASQIIRFRIHQSYKSGLKIINSSTGGLRIRIDLMQIRILIQVSSVNLIVTFLGNF